MGKHKIPDRWLDYTPLGKCIDGTKIVAFKVPLKKDLCSKNQLKEEEWFTPEKLIEQQPNLKTVIDLTNTDRYYNPREEFGSKGIDHIKILVEGRGSIPANWQIQRFFKAVDTHMEKYNDVADALVGVHCTHGLNRTGYFICRYLVDRLKFGPDDAITRFNQARGHDIEREPLLNDIRLTDRSKIKNVLPPPLSASASSPRSSNDYRSPLDNDYYSEECNDRYRNRGRKSRDGEINKNDGYRGRHDRGRGGSSRSDLDTNWRARDKDESSDSLKDLKITSQKNEKGGEWRKNKYKKKKILNKDSTPRENNEDSEKLKSPRENEVS